MAPSSQARPRRTGWGTPAGGWLRFVTPPALPAPGLLGIWGGSRTIPALVSLLPQMPGVRRPVLSSWEQEREAELWPLRTMHWGWLWRGRVPQGEPRGGGGAGAQDTDAPAAEGKRRVTRETDCFALWQASQGHPHCHPSLRGRGVGGSLPASTPGKVTTSMPVLATKLNLIF